MDGAYVIGVIKIEKEIIKIFLSLLLVMSKKSRLNCETENDAAIFQVWCLHFPNYVNCTNTFIFLQMKK